MTKPHDINDLSSFDFERDLEGHMNQVHNHRLNNLMGTPYEEMEALHKSEHIEMLATKGTHTKVIERPLSVVVHNNETDQDTKYEDVLSVTGTENNEVQLHFADRQLNLANSYVALVVGLPERTKII